MRPPGVLLLLPTAVRRRGFCCAMSGIPNLKHQGVCLDSLEGASSKEELLRSQLFVPSGTTEAAKARRIASIAHKSSRDDANSVCA